MNRSEIMKKLLTVDGSNLLFQMFFGMPERIMNAQGKAIQGTLGFVGALLKIIRWVEPTNVVVLFDGEHENERTSIDAEYKANRIDYSEESEENNPFSQLPDVYSALDFLGIRHAEASVCEVDDWIAGYVNRYKSSAEIIISSWDSDFFSLIAPNVSVLRYRGEKTVICDTAYIEDKFGIAPEQYADYKSLVGDKVDNIKGAEGIGQKTAARLLNDCGSLEKIIECAEKIEKKSVRESIIRSISRLRNNYQLIKLNGFDELPFAFEDTEYQYNGVTTTEVLKAIGLK